MMFFPALAVTLPVGIFDITTSVVADTVVSPLDIANHDNENSRATSGMSCYTF